MEKQLNKGIEKIERIRNEYEMSLLSVINGLIKYLHEYGIQDIQKRITFDTAIYFTAENNNKFYISLQGKFTINRTISYKTEFYKKDIIETWEFNSSNNLLSKLADLLCDDE